MNPLSVSICVVVALHIERYSHDVIDSPLTVYTTSPRQAH